MCDNTASIAYAKEVCNNLILKKAGIDFCASISFLKAM